MRLRFAAACLIGALSVTAGAAPAFAQKKAATAKRAVPAKKAVPTAARKAPAPLSPEAAFLAKNRRLPGVVQTASGVQYRVSAPVAGAHPTDTDVALINYEGKLVDGTTFDKSTQPTPMPVAAVVPGFSEALKLMAKGEKIRVWIPSRLAYGPKDQRDETGKVVIPADATLVFDIELIDFLPQTVVEGYMRQMQAESNSGGPVPEPVPTPTDGKPATN